MIWSDEVEPQYPDVVMYELAYAIRFGEESWAEYQAARETDRLEGWRVRERCLDCGVFHSNGDQHLCVRYNNERPCSVCGAGTVFVLVAAPGTGDGYSCRNGHFDGWSRELTLSDVR